MLTQNVTFLEAAHLSGLEIRKPTDDEIELVLCFESDSYAHDTVRVLMADKELSEIDSLIERKRYYQQYYKEHLPVLQKASMVYSFPNFDQIIFIYCSLGILTDKTTGDHSIFAPLVKYLIRSSKEIQALEEDEVAFDL